MEDQVEAPPRGGGRARKGLLGLAAALALVLAYNLTVWTPAAMKLGADERNAVLGVHVYRSWLAHPSDITVDLVVAGDAATVDLARALLQAAEALKGRKFGTVTLARQGKPVFAMGGREFSDLGYAVAEGSDSLDMVTTLPSLLQLPNGEPAFVAGVGGGGWLDGFTQQLDDLNTFGLSWAMGEVVPGSTAVEP